MSANYPLERDVFISYAHLDNEALTEADKGWVSVFDSALKKRLAQLLGRKPDVWRDENRLQGNDYFSDEIIAQFPKLKVLISIISPRYLESEWCRKELLGFYQAAQAKGGVRVGNKSRIFKVIKTPVPREQFPEEVQGLLGYEFFEKEADGHFREFRLDKESPTYYQFIERFEDVAQDLSQLIRKLDTAALTSVPTEITAVAANPPEKTVYLAVTTSDLSGDRDNIRRDLSERGYTVLPDQELPLDSRLRETVSGYLKRCKLAIHLVGGKYGLVPEDEERSLLEIQCQLSSDATLNRLIWMPPDPGNGDERQQRFLTDLQESAAREGSELLRSKLEDFKTVIVDTLEKLAAPAPSVVAGDSSTPRIYLMFDQSDRETVTAIDDYLYNRGFEVLLPVFEGNESDIREIHKENLRICDAVLIYYNQASEPWINFKMNDLRKAPGYGRSEPFLASAVYIAGEQNRFKERFRTREASLIKQFKQFTTQDLDEFISQIRRKKGGAA